MCLALTARDYEKDALDKMCAAQQLLAETPWWKFSERRRIKDQIETWGNSWEQWGRTADMAGVFGHEYSAAEYKDFRLNKHNVWFIEEVGGEDKPHTIINCDGRVHVVPESFFQDVIDGKRDFTDVDDWQEMLRTILRDWMAMLKEWPHDF